MKHEEPSPEFHKKAEACNTPEELADLAESEGIELSEGDLDAIAGGARKRRRKR